MKVKYYHSSSRRFKVGDILRPASAALGVRGVFLTTTPIPHYTVMDYPLHGKSSWHVYEVEPLTKVKEGEWNDLYTQSAKIIKYVGNAKGIANRASKTYKDKDKDFSDTEYILRNQIPFGSKINKSQLAWILKKNKSQY